MVGNEDAEELRLESLRVAMTLHKPTSLGQQLRGLIAHGHVRPGLLIETCRAKCLACYTLPLLRTNVPTAPEYTNNKVHVLMHTQGTL